VQDAFLSAFRALPSFEAMRSSSTWLHRIVVNASLMKLRTRRRKPEQSIEELLPATSRTAISSARRRLALEDLDPAERADLRDLVMRQHPRRCRRATVTCCCCADIEDLDNRGGREAVGISPGAVKTRLHRARQALRELLEPHLAEGSA
jgi:RNA polymerase sigma-70 factor (ECF subfamily)